MYLETFFVLLTFFLMVFLVGQFLKDNSIVDMAWGSGFVISAMYTFLRNSESGLKGILITGAISIWGLRLTYHIGRRNLGKPEDFRYVNMRKRWGHQYVLLKAFLNVYFLQFIIQYIVTLPIIYGNLTNQKLYWYNYLGVILWIIGFFFEAYGDYQLKNFKENPANKGRLMDKGLWALTRHPNYFGDAAMWFGVFIIALSNIEGAWTIVGPSLMTFLLIFVSGVKMLEKKYKGREDYDLYKKRTSGFIPWFPKKGV